MILSLQKPHVSGKPPGILPFVQILCVKKQSGEKKTEVLAVFFFDQFFFFKKT